MSTEALEQKAVEIITNLEKLAEPAMQLTLQAVQLGAVIDIAVAVSAIVLITFGWLRYGPKAINWIRDCDSAMVIPAGIALIIVSVISIIAYIAVCITLLSTTTWMAVFAPKIALARMLLEKAL